MCVILARCSSLSHPLGPCYLHPLSLSECNDMKPVPSLVLACTLLTFSTSSQSQQPLGDPEKPCTDFYTAQDLIRPQCTDETLAYFRGFFEGQRSATLALSGASSLNETLGFQLSCPPLDAPLNELFFSVLELVMTTNQNFNSMTAREVLFTGLIAAYPCPESLPPVNGQ